MTDREPPGMAVWLLKKGASPYQLEALMGDLLEMYRDGRSPSWYWRQVIAALLIARLRAFRMLSWTIPASALLRLVNALIWSGLIALGLGSLTQADTARTEVQQTHHR